MKLSALIAPLLNAKADHETIRAVVLAFEAEQSNALEERRRADADRQARKREREKSRDVTLRHSDRSLTGAGVAPVEDKTSKLDIEPQVREVGKSPAKPSPRHRLEEVLSADLAEAVLDHRQRLRKPLTERAAKSLAAELAKFPDPNAAADRMIAKGWASIDFNWPEAHPGGGAQQRAGPPQKRGIADALGELEGFLNNGRSQNSSDDKAPTGVVLSLPYRVAQ